MTKERELLMKVHDRLMIEMSGYMSAELAEIMEEIEQHLKGDEG